MDYNISKPSPFLSQYVKYYWSLENCIHGNTQHTQRIVPSGLFELVFYQNDKPVSTANDNVTDSVIISGHQKGFYDLKVSGKLSLFAIYFHPHGLAMFLDIPLTELYNHSIPMRLILKDRISKLEEDIQTVDSFEKRISVTEKFLVDQLGKNETKYQYERIRHTVNLINQNKGVVDIEILAAESCLSRKQFERTFSEIIGATPKQFLKIIRFQNTIFQKSQSPALSLTEIAHNCGYYDQAHMINDFKTLSGFTPKQFFEDSEPFSDYFN